MQLPAISPRHKRAENRRPCTNVKVCGTSRLHEQCNEKLHQTSTGGAAKPFSRNANDNRRQLRKVVGTIRVPSFFVARDKKAEDGF
jgi:hypothetical protein